MSDVIEPARRCGDRVPDFHVRRLGGTDFEYGDIWQRRNILLLSVSDADSSEVRDYVSRLVAAISELPNSDTECVITSERVAGLSQPGVLVADRWGEIQFASHVSTVTELPLPEEVMLWVRHVEHQCPECEGEAR
jgi:hypothetical protein